jgi:uncharacterized membrane protein
VLEFKIKKINKFIMTTKVILRNVLIFGGLIGVLCSFLITIEKINLIANPSYIPSCNINPFISCGSVMKTPQASLFGFPNSLLGILGFSIMLTVGMAELAGAKFKKWFWVTAEIGITLAVIFVYWLFYQSIYRIGALCPYCMVVWVVTIPMFWYLTLYNLEEKNIVVCKNQEKFVFKLKKNNLLILSIFYLVIFLSILIHFWSYWKMMF